MEHIFYKLGDTVKRLYTGKYLVAQIFAVVATYFIVMSGFDFIYYLAFDETYLQHLFFSAVVIGGFAPIVFPLWILVYGHIFKNKKVTILGNMLVQSVIFGWTLSSFYKVWTGRVPPSHTLNTLIDLSRDFRFGFLDGGIFWGWPSSHTAVAFAMAVTIWSVYPKHILIKYSSLIYAIFIGFGVSLSIHWFSDAIAGAIFGSIVGISIGHSFTSKIEQNS